MQKETNNTEKEKKRFYNLTKEELKLLELSFKIKSESSPYLYGEGPQTGVVTGGLTGSI